MAALIACCLAWRAKKYKRGEQNDGPELTEKTKEINRQLAEADAKEKGKKTIKPKLHLPPVKIFRRVTNRPVGVTF